MNSKKIENLEKRTAVFNDGEDGITGVLHESEYHDAMLDGAKIDGVLVVPDPLTPADWSRKARKDQAELMARAGR
jgi:hypothetical protein